MFKSLLQYLLFSVLSFLLFIVVVVIIAAVTMGPNVKDNSVLLVNLSGPVMEEGPQGLLEKYFLGDVLTTREIILTIDKARRDERIKGLMVTALGSQMGLGKTQEIRSAIQSFAAKKPAYGYLEDGDTLEYYLCSAAPKLYMAPAGEGGVSLTGLRSEVPFFKGTLDKLGIVAQMDHIGEYKSASDIWTRDSMSDAHRESTESILNSIYERITSDIGRDRKISKDQVQQTINRGPLVRSEVKDAGLVNGLLYRDEVEEQIKKDLKGGKVNFISISEYKEPTFSESFRGARTRIGIVYASGAIMTGESSKGYSEDTMGSTTISKAIRQARDDESVKAIILRVDSPGGSAVASDLIWREVSIAKKKKPVIVSMADVAASGGYYVSMGASKILSNPSTVTGSIGVVFGKFYLKGLYDKIGLNKEIVKKGEFADLYSDYVPFEEAEWQIVHKHMDAIYDAFTEKAAQGRKKTQAEIDSIGKGRVWSGDQALELGLVDQLGGLNDAIREARKLAKIPDNEDIGFSLFPARKGGFSDMLSTQTRASIELPDELTRMLTWAKITEREHLLLLMPYDFKLQ